MFNDTTNWESEGAQQLFSSSVHVATYAARFRPGYWCFCGPGSEKTWKYNEERPFLQFADGVVGETRS